MVLAIMLSVTIEPVASRVRGHNLLALNNSANLYSLLPTRKENGIDGYGYLRRLLIDLPKGETANDY